MICVRLLRAVMLLVLLMTGVAHADRKEDAQKAAAQGDRAFEKADYKAALAGYQASYTKYPKPFLLYRIAECQFQLGRFDDALAGYRSYVAKVTKGADRKKAQARIAELEKAPKPEAAPTPPPVAPVPQATDTEAPPVVDNDPKHKAPIVTTATAPKADEVPPGYEPPGTVPRDPVPFILPPPPKRPIYKKWWFWTAIGVVVVGAGVGLALGFTIGMPKFQSELPVGGPGASSALVVHPGNVLTVKF